MSDPIGTQDLKIKTRTIVLLCLAELLGMSVWFSATAVVPSLITHWNLTGADVAWLTMAVQIGFVVGTFVSSMLNLADYFSGPRMVATSSFFAALCTALIALLDGNIGLVFFLRFLTGVFLAGVYPVGMKIIATWTKADRGLGIGLLVGALTVGSASPHLLNALGGLGDWRSVLGLSSVSAALGGALTFLYVKEGPYQLPLRKIDWKYAFAILGERDLALANLGYLGHMWELYAMWAWIPVFLLSSFKLVSVDPLWAGLAAFAVIAVGGLGSILAGLLADRFGRTTITIASMMVSGSCALLVGLLYGGSAVFLTTLCLLWGFAIVADSAQFSACITELCQPEHLGTALTLQTCLGFLLTMVTIRLIPVIVDWVTWKWAFAFLSIGPLGGVWAMYTLRRLPAAGRLAGGRK